MTTTIMVIDDEPLIGQLIGYQLGDAGYTVQAFQSAREALIQLAHSQPDLVLLDVMMPEISGYDLCREIRAFSEVPLIMLTAKHADEDIVAGLTIGADDYIGKPFSAPQLEARIEAVLRRSGRVPAARSARPRPTALPPTAPPPPSTPIQRPTASPPRLGSQFRAARHSQGLSLHAAGDACGVRWEFLQAIEQEQFSYIPRDKLRSALHSYSTLLGVDLAPYGRSRARSRSLRANIALVAILTLISILVLAILML